MTFCCSQCSFTAQFESALTMHHQLHHGSTIDWDPKKLNTTAENSNTVPRAICQDRPPGVKDNKGTKLGRTSSATRLLGKLRARICRSKTLFVHPEEGSDHLNMLDLTSASECTSKVLKDTSRSCSPVLDFREAKRETFACHLCPFEADRITVLDRHLLNDHKIGLDSLLKLVMNKTKDGLSEDSTVANVFGVRQPYYKPSDEIIEEGEFIVESVTPKIKILKHASLNTDLKGSDIAHLFENLKITEENALDIDDSSDLNCDTHKRDLLVKMKTLNDCMCKFVDSSNMLKKVLSKELDQKTNGRSDRTNDKSAYNIGLGDQETPKYWERAHSEKLERSRSKYGESSLKGVGAGIHWVNEATNRGLFRGSNTFVTDFEHDNSPGLEAAAKR